MRKNILPIITILLTLVAIVIIAEIVFRIDDLFDKNRGLKNSMGNINSKYYHDFKPNRRFRLVASKNNEYDVDVRINNYGFRGKDISRDKKPGAIRIMAMGDSFVFGIGAHENETIPFLIERYLLGQVERAEVINTGFGSYSPLLHYLKVKDEYLKFKPNLVLYFFDFSDLADDWRYERSLVYDNSGRILRCHPAFVNGRRDWWKTIRMHSKLCVFIHNKIIRLVDKIRIIGLKNYIKAKMKGRRAKALIAVEEVKEEEFDPIGYDGYLMLRGRNRAPQIPRHFKRTEKYLNLIKNILAEEEIPMLLIIYPYGIHVGPDQWGRGREYWGFEKGRVYEDYYAFELLEDYADRNNVPYINVLPIFLKNSDKNLFFDIDGHFTPEANRIVAETIVHSKTFEKVLNSIRGGRRGG